MTTTLNPDGTYTIVTPTMTREGRITTTSGQFIGLWIDLLA